MSKEGGVPWAPQLGRCLIMCGAVERGAEVWGWGAEDGILGHGGGVRGSNARGMFAVSKAVRICAVRKALLNTLNSLYLRRNLFVGSSVCIVELGGKSQATLLRIFNTREMEKGQLGCQWQREAISNRERETYISCFSSTRVTFLTPFTKNLHLIV